MKPVKDARGFTTFRELECSYGTKIRVKESSTAGAPRIWIFMQENSSVLTRPELGAAAAHLSLKQARQLIDGLQAAIDGHYQLRPSELPKRNPEKRRKT